MPVPREEAVHHTLADPHHRTRWVADVVLGGQDGLVNVLGMVLGLVAAASSTRIILVAGLSAALSESVSMAAVAYTSTVARGELYRSERAREYRHIETVPHVEQEEVRSIYARKGFSGDLLERIVTTITSDKDVWVAVMMAEEHGLGDVDRRNSLKSAARVGAASLVGSLLPLAPFAFLPPRGGAWAVALTASFLVLFAFGAYKAKVTVGSPLKSGLGLAAIGLASALVGYGVGAVIGATPSV
jgi:VIT1/CCC1 family predicted Fe2+/Mn2+ transporter